MCKIPWLMLRLKTDSITFFSVSNGFSRHVDLPKASNRSSWCFSSKGWLIEIESVKLTISLLHPFSLRQLELPSINSFPYSSNDWTNDINDTDVGIFLIIRCVLSSSFCPNSDSSQVQAMLIYGRNRILPTLDLVIRFGQEFVTAIILMSSTTEINFMLLMV